MSIISYAQNFEDVMLWRALGHIDRGFYIDIGAQDPTIDSVSRAFHEHGWHGIHVEPTPHYAELLRQQRPGDTVIQAAVGNGPALSRFYEIPNTGISTADAGIAAQHRERGFDVQEIIVTFVTLSAIFETCAEEIHWLKIDVEGFEQQLLSSWGASTVRPWIVIVESTLPLTQIETHDSWESIIIDYGYSPVYFDGLNRYYVSDAHAELKAAFTSPPNVFDGFTLNGTASAPFHRLIEERCQEKISEAVTQSEQQKTVLQHEATLLSASLSSLTETYAGQQQSWLQTEQALSEQNRHAKQELEALHQRTSQARQEIENILRTQVQREQDVAAQLLAVYQQADREKAELVRSHSEQERAMHSQHADREKEHAEQTRQARLELETLLRQQLLREQQVAAELLAAQQEAQQEKAELARSQSEQARALHSQHAEREQSLNEQLLIRQQELHQQHQSHTDRAQEVAEKLLAMALQQQAAESAAEQAHSQREQERKLHLLYAEREEKLKQQLQDRQEDLQNLQKDRARREQEMGAQLLALQQQAAQEMVSQAQKHSEQASALHHLHAEREQSLIQERQAGQQDLRRLEQDRAQREKDHAEQTGQSQQELESLLRNQAQREQEINAQLLTILQQAQQDKAEHTRLLDACAEVEARLQDEMQSGQQASMHLHRLLTEVQHNLDLTHASLSWRMTAPLRKLVGMFGSPRGQALAPDEGSTSTRKSELGTTVAAEVPPMPEPSSANNPITPEQSTAAAAEAEAEAPSMPMPANAGDLITPEQNTSTAIKAAPLVSNPEPFGLTISQLADPTAKNMSTNASTLSELLACHDQQFVHCAYKTLLGRAPDPEGFHYYLDRIRTGFSKIQIVAQLCLSNEGKAYASKLSGLNAAIQRYQKGQRPLVGVLYRCFNGVEGNHPIERKLRVIQNQLGLLNDESSHRFNQMEVALAGLHHLVVQKTQSVVAALGNISTESPNFPDIQPIQSSEPSAPSEPEGFQQLSPRAKDIYFQLTTAAFIRAERIV